MKKLILLIAVLLALPAFGQIARRAANCTGVSSCTTTGNAAGDLEIAFAGRNGSTGSVPPTVPAGWTSVGSANINGTSTADSSVVMACKVTTGTNESSSTFTNADHIVIMVWSGQLAGNTATCASAILGTPSFFASTVNTTTTTETFNTITTGAAGSWVAGFGYCSACTAGIGTAPASMSNRSSLAGPPSVGGHDTNAAIGTFNSANVTLTTAGRILTGTVEIKAALLTTPTYDNGTSTYNNTVSVTPTLAAGTTGCYTTDNSAPTATTPGTCLNGTTWNTGNAAISIAATGTVLRMIATEVGFPNSAEASATYTLQVANPAFGTNGGSFNNDTSSTQTSSTTSTVFCQTVDGTTAPAANTPGTCSTGTTGASATILATGKAIKVLGTKANYVNSSVQTSSTFTLTVGAVSSSPGAGTYGSTQSVTLTVATTTGATILYTTDGSTPVCPATGTTYTGAFNVAVTTTLNIIGCKTNYASSGVQTDVYTVGSAATASLSTSSIAFGTQTNLTNSAASSVTVTNTGSNSLTISSIAIAGTNAGDFTISGNTCTGTLAGGSSTCVVSVVFNPGSQGSRSGTLTFTTSAASSPDVVTLTGTGAWPAASQCTVAVTFTPATNTARSGTLTLADNASDSPQVITLTGTGGGPPSTLGTLTVDYASISPGRSAILSWTASGDTNLACSIDQGVGALTISDPNGSSGTKTVSPATPGSITYTMSCTSTTGTVAPTATVLVTRPSAGPF